MDGIVKPLGQPLESMLCPGALAPFHGALRVALGLKGGGCWARGDILSHLLSHTAWAFLTATTTKGMGWKVLNTQYSQETDA